MLLATVPRLELRILQPPTVISAVPHPPHALQAHRMRIIPTAVRPPARRQISSLPTHRPHATHFIKSSKLLTPSPPSPLRYSPIPSFKSVSSTNISSSLSTHGNPGYLLGWPAAQRGSDGNSRSSRTDPPAAVMRVRAAGKPDLWVAT